MTIWTFVNPAFLIAELGRSGAAAATPVPVYDLCMAAVAIAAWALAVGVIAARLRARERSAAQAHIRSMLVARRDGGATSRMVRRTTNPAAVRHSWSSAVHQQ